MVFQEERWVHCTEEEWNKQIASMVHVVEEFRLIAKLSGAGIVVRVLDVPQTNKPFIGKQLKGQWEIAQVISSGNVGPYQPMMHLRFTPLTAAGEKEGTTEYAKVHIQLRPHPDVHMLGSLEWVAGILSIIAGIIGAIQNPIALFAILLGVAIIGLPRLRARLSFQQEIERAQDALQNLGVQWIEKPQ